MSETNDFQKECDERVKRIAEHLTELYEGVDTSELEDKLEELEDNEPLEPEQEEGESDEEFDARYDAWEKEWEEWEKERDSVQEEIDGIEEKTLNDYFDDYLDLSYIVNESKEYESVRVWVTIGGPSIYVDTDKGAVILNWGGTHSEYYLSRKVSDAIDDIFEERYNW